MRHALIPAGLILSLSAALPAAAQDRPELTVYAPDYFASDWGPGPKIEEAFEQVCGCGLVWSTGDVLPRLLLEGERSEADVAIGLTGDISKKARESGLFAPHGQSLEGLSLPVDWTDGTFLPFDWSYVAFVYDKARLASPPESFRALVEAPDDLRIVIQDPRSSESGLALLLWVKSVFGDEAEAVWESLAPKIVTVTPDWSTAYGLFTEGEADMVLSFTTSPAYHLIAEEDDTKAAAIFPEGHYVMVELAAKLAATDDPELADRFMDFILDPAFQSLIPTANWSYPAKLDEADWPQAFRELNRPGKALWHDEDEAAALREGALEEWRRALAQ